MNKPVIEDPAELAPTALSQLPTSGAPWGAGENRPLERLVDDLDWARTPLGPRERWPHSLNVASQILLTSRFAMWMGWGPELTMLYNNAYARMTLGKKHPWALGRSAREVWAEIWPEIGPRIQLVLERGAATWDEGLLLFLERSGFTEETYHTFSYSRLAGDDGRIAGMLCVVTEETERIIGERQLASLRELASQLATTNSREQVWNAIRRGIGANAKDLPFSLTYLFEDGPSPDGARGPANPPLIARLVCSTGIEAGHPAAPPRLNLGIEQSEGEGASVDPWSLSQALGHPGPILVPDLHARFGALPTGAWHIPPTQALVVPIAEQGREQPAGVLIAGLNPYRLQTADYTGFVELLAGQIASSLANANAYESERRRAEALAELDRAKTQFFSNVSHEFRTPLTLLLGPLEDALNRRGLPEATLQELELAHRNAVRLLRLVNTLLDFSRIEAGRIEAVYEPADIASYTAELASSFRSAIDRAGISLVIDAPPLISEGNTVWLDRDLWEKVILNLLSNAFKHTFEGQIVVQVRPAGDRVEVIVSDTGVGIPPSELAHIFDRFHRVPNARSRTYEGTGIGLSLAKELVRLHGGTIEVVSEEGVGTTFTVSVPVGKDHLPPDRVGRGGTLRRRNTPPGSFDLETMAHVDEVSRWLGRPTPTPPPRVADAASRGHVLLVDDNADMREYVARLLRENGWHVETAGDGMAALEAIGRHRPDLVLSDVMMPRLDGFGLLRALRNDAATSTLPVILLSARAGDEARVEGVQAGADDYLVKPFAARELISRVGTHIALARERERLLEAERDARRMSEEERLRAEEANRAKSQFLATMSHELRTPLNAIAGYVEMLEIGLRGPLTDSQRLDLGRIRRNQQHLLGLINDVLNFAKLEAGRVEFEFEEVALQPLLEDVSTLVRPQLETKRLRYDTRGATTLSVRADRDKLQQVVLNLLSNAIKFTESDGAITVSCSRDDTGRVMIAVGDTGVGIPPSKLEAVFEPFVQVDPRLSGARSGTGLGLSISRELARAMGGDLTVTSTMGSGSVFLLVLPGA